ncbi:MAG TPA: ThuA domain-containing protein [Thermoanaerobaculia bacterium]|nr:ThuA domain-containing protein [Thermoanaerobaculia bacterium]
MITIVLASALSMANVIVVTATEGYRHESIETAEEVVAEIGRDTGWFVPRFVRSEEELSTAMTPAALAETKLVMFVNTTGELEWPERARLLEWVAAGGAFFGVHSAADTWHQWPEYLDMLGAEFAGHPPESEVEVVVDDWFHPSTRHMTAPHRVVEEIYFFDRFSRDRVKMLLSLRVAPDDGRPGFFPLAWHRRHGRGLVLYTALGHRIDVWQSEWFRLHLQGAIEAALAQPSRRRRAVGR